jgi:hypothetical protein
MAITVMAWNISLFPDEEQSHVQGMLLERLPTQLSGEDVGVLLRRAITGSKCEGFELYWSQARSGCCPLKKLLTASTRTS